MTAAVWTPTFTVTLTPLPINTPVPSATLTPTETLTPTPLATATVTETVTLEKPTAKAQVNAYFRLGPGEAHRSSGALFRKDKIAAINGKRITVDGIWYLKKWMM